MFRQQSEPIRDSFQNRWIQYEEYGKIKRDTDFWSYGDFNHVNLEQCNSSFDKKREKYPSPGYNQSRPQ